MAHRTRKQILPPSKPTTSCELSSQRPSSLPSGTTDVATNCLEVGQVCFRPSTALATSCVVRTDSVRDCVTDSCRCGRPVSTLDPPMKPTPTSRAANNTGRSVSRATASLVWGPLASFSGACLIVGHLLTISCFVHVLPASVPSYSSTSTSSSLLTRNRCLRPAASTSFSASILYTYELPTYCICIAPRCYLLLVLYCRSALILYIHRHSHPNFCTPTCIPCLYHIWALQ